MISGREKTLETTYIQLNPLKVMTAELFKKPIGERRAVREAKDNSKSQSALSVIAVINARKAHSLSAK